jgi:YbgC/YbaW family acyl-CoA thioester hydrolase
MAASRPAIIFHGCLGEIISALFEIYAPPQADIARRVIFRKIPRMPDPPPSLETREEVMFFDTDCGGVVHNLAYLRMIETCRTRLAALMGMDLRTMSQTHVFPVVTRTEIDYKRPAKLGDWITICGRLDELSRARFWCAFEMIRESDGATLVTARQALALVAMPEGKPMRLPAEWAERWG